MWAFHSLLKSIQYEVKRMFEIFISTYPTLLKATIVTLQLTLTSLVLGSLIGLLFAFFRISNNKVLNSIAHIYIAIIRGTPLIVQIAILYFGITSVIVFSLLGRSNRFSNS